MKKLAFVLALLIATPAFANAPCTSGCPSSPPGPTKVGTAFTGTTNNTTNITATPNSQSDSAANNAGNSQSIVFSSPGETRQTVIQEGTTTVKNTPSVNAPPLTSSNDTCMGSMSGSVNGPGFGVSLGSTYKDINCVMLKNSRELWNMGMRAAALARMCMDPDNREALEITGFECPRKAEPRAQPGVATSSVAK